MKYLKWLPGLVLVGSVVTLSIIGPAAAGPVGLGFLIGGIVTGTAGLVSLYYKTKAKRELKLCMEKQKISDEKIAKLNQDSKNRKSENEQLASSIRHLRQEYSQTNQAVHEREEKSNNESLRLSRVVEDLKQRLTDSEEKDASTQANSSRYYFFNNSRINQIPEDTDENPRERIRRRLAQQ